MDKERQDQSKLKERTRAFFTQEVDELASALQGRIIIDIETGKWLRLDKIEPWWKEASRARQVGNRYNTMEQMQPGDLWICRFPLRRINQTLIVAQDKGSIGACIRILRTSILNTDIGNYEPALREGDTTTILGFNHGDVAKLCFLDESEILYLQRTKNNSVITPEDANKQLRKILEG